MEKLEGQTSKQLPILKYWMYCLCCEPFFDLSPSSHLLSCAPVKFNHAWCSHIFFLISSFPFLQTGTILTNPLPYLCVNLKKSN